MGIDYLRALNKSDLIGLHEKWVEDIKYARRAIEQNEKHIKQLAPKLVLVEKELEKRRQNEKTMP